MFLNHLFTDMSSIYTAIASKEFDNKRFLLYKAYHGNGLLSFFKNW